MIILNCKNYIFKNISDDEFLDILRELSLPNNSFAIIPPVSKLQHYTKELLYSGIEVISPHVDFITSPKSTGFVSSDILNSIGVTTSLLNHSEHRLNIDNTLISNLQNVKKNIIWCFNDEDFENNLELLKNIYNLENIIYLAYEPSSLIGSKTSSVMIEKLDRLIEIGKYFNTKKILLGAGIKSKQDFQKVEELNFGGTLISSAVMESNNSKEELERILNYI